VIEAFTGDTTIDCNIRLAAVIIVEPLTLPEVAVIVAEPGFRAVTTPDVLTEARPPALEDHVAVEVRSWLPPSL
jgi:hypothetical protein